MKNLSKEELLEINGGGFTNAISIAFTTDSLLSLRFERNHGDRHSVTEISVGNDIDLNLGLAGKN